MEDSQKKKFGWESKLIYSWNFRSLIDIITSWDLFKPNLIKCANVRGLIDISISQDFFKQKKV